MSDLSSPLATPVLPVALPTAVPTSAKALHGTTDETAKRAQIAKSGKDFESAFLNIMLGQMMSGVKTSTFGGGEGEDAFKSFMTDAMAKSIVRHGGIGLAKVISADMLKMQGLAANPTATPMAKTAAAPAAKSPATASSLDIAA